MMIYLSHPYGGREANRKAVEAIAERLAQKDRANVYVSPIHAFGYLYDQVDYFHGLSMCIELLSRCDRMLVFGDWKHSVGCRAEMEYSKAHGIPVALYGGDGEGGKTPNG